MSTNNLKVHLYLNKYDNSFSYQTTPEIVWERTILFLILLSYKEQYQYIYELYRHVLKYLIVSEI